MANHKDYKIHNHGKHKSAEAEAKYRAAAQKNKLKLEYFSEARVNLMRECNNHPLLVEFLMENPEAPWEEMLGEIAAYCGIILDGTYLPFELEALYVKMYDQLRADRSPLTSGNQNITIM